MTDFRQQFLAFAERRGALAFGDFKTKAGRQSPYFFNTGRFADGEALLQLGHAYAAALKASQVEFDVLFGPAYKGITLAAALAMSMAQAGRNVPFVYNRKEAKDHGEGGVLVGPPLAGRVLIVDDVISAGTSVRESVVTIRNAGATVAGVVIAVDRQERGGTADVLTATSAAEDVRVNLGIPVIAVVTLADVLTYARRDGLASDLAHRIEAYRDKYGVV
jgi:orotate phosphoribosyltransferase